MRGLIIVVVAGAMVVQVSRARAACVDLPGSHREMEVPAGWTASASELYAAGDDFANAELGGIAVMVQPPEVHGGSCEERPVEGGEIPQTTVFGSRYSRFAFQTTDRYYAFGACIDTSRGSMVVNVAVPLDGNSRDPRYLEITEAIADMLATDIQCAWEPAGGNGGGGAGLPWSHDFGFALAAGQVAKSVPDMSQLFELRASMLSSTRGATFGVDARGGFAVGGAREIEAGFAAGATIGHTRRFQILATLGFRSVKSGDTPAVKSIGPGLRGGVVWPLPARLVLRARAELLFLSTVIPRPEPTPDEFSELELEPVVAAGVSRGKLYAGLEVRELGATTVISLLLGIELEGTE